MKENPLHLQQQQIEKLKELGSRLRQVREEQSMSLEEVGDRTRIQVRLLKAIEEGRREILPEPVYIQGFIKRYADALGLDGVEYSDTFPSGPIFQLIKPTWRYLPSPQLRPIHLYLMYVFLVIGAVNGLSYVVNRPALEVGKGETNQRSPSQPSNKADTDSPEKLGPFTPAVFSSNTNQPGKPVRVGVTVKTPSWVRVVVDGKTQFEGLLPQGTQRTWVAQETLIVKAGNAGGILVAFNDEKAKKLGAPGKVREVTFAANPPGS
ncbi:RodZ domain-containing protein [Coleofasciculus sp. FACHB-1120]|uniref:helix-turn-helix domain-containing protein n=1 Tax=Coleofasciculus sp. FACHB-1120 TaxID=2692783 RepID=UPI001684A73D|nr:RodZ domain-containing protein [Coleofasciculus sp. FACHB-1120]MBD2740488.1 helix-turn-helix domain-containing protein [Coleofasciculus sp. FACHB-1120]